eukprot:6179474-Pleurochrysis_carterae.AAC.3
MMKEPQVSQKRFNPRNGLCPCRNALVRAGDSRRGALLLGLWAAAGVLVLAGRRWRPAAHPAQYPARRVSTKRASRDAI